MDLQDKCQQIAQNYIMEPHDETSRTLIQKDMKEAVTEMYPKYTGEDILVGMNTDKNAYIVNVPSELIKYALAEYPHTCV